MEKNFFNNNILIDENNSPFLKDYSEFLIRIENSLLKLVNEERFSYLKNNIEKLVNLLLIEGNVQEDVVIKTSIIYYLTLNDIAYNKLNIKLSQTLLKGLDILCECNKKENYDNVFLGTMPYLSKVQLAILIIKLDDSNLDLIKKRNLRNLNTKIILKYYTKVKNNLMKLLIEKNNLN